MNVRCYYSNSMRGIDTKRIVDKVANVILTFLLINTFFFDGTFFGERNVGGFPVFFG